MKDQGRERQRKRRRVGARTGLRRIAGAERLQFFDILVHNVNLAKVHCNILPSLMQEFQVVFP